jgi:hypothetical protein
MERTFEVHFRVIRPQSSQPINILGQSATVFKQQSIATGDNPTIARLHHHLMEQVLLKRAYDRNWRLLQVATFSLAQSASSASHQS